MDREHTTEAVIDAIAEVGSVDRDRVQADMTLMGRDLGLDSVTILRLIIKLEQLFPGRLQVKDAADLGVTSIDDLVELLAGGVGSES
jgi:acyl carrier protein